MPDNKHHIRLVRPARLVLGDHVAYAYWVDRPAQGKPYYIKAFKGLQWRTMRITGIEHFGSAFILRGEYFGGAEPKPRHHTIIIRADQYAALSLGWPSEMIQMP